MPKDRYGGAGRSGLRCTAPAGVAVRTASRVRQWVAVLPAPLGRLATAELATEMEAAGPPAGVRKLALEAVGDRYAQPTVLLDVPEDCPAVLEETFGPTLTIAKVPDMDEAVRRTNASAYGLGATVFSRARGTELARQIRSGMVAVNSVSSFAAIPSLPFGGVKQSGFGRVHGPAGLREFAAAKA